MLPSKRSEQLEKSLKREVNNIIYRKINDPRIKFVTITRIKVSSDLKYADIFVTIFNDEDKQKKALKGLKNATKFIRGELGKDLKMRYVPNIKFKIDEDLERQYKLLKIVTEVHKSIPFSIFLFFIFHSWIPAEVYSNKNGGGNDRAANNFTLYDFIFLNILTRLQRSLMCNM